MPIIKYFILTIKHKYFVLIAGLKLKVPLWKLLIHDLSKFSYDELPHYGRQFFGKADDPEGFIKCWLRHQNRNSHHWEYWIPRTGHNRCNPPYEDMKPIPMPTESIREMVADWVGAGRAYNKKWPDMDNWEWLENNRSRMVLHPITETRLDRILEEAKKKRRKGNENTGNRNKELY